MAGCGRIVQTLVSNSSPRRLCKEVQYIRWSLRVNFRGIVPGFVLGNLEKRETSLYVCLREGILATVTQYSVIIMEFLMLGN